MKISNQNIAHKEFPVYFNDNHKHQDIFGKDIWHANDLGIKPDAAQSTYKLNFNKLNSGWFRELIKRFVYYQSATKTFQSCRSYIVGLTHFSNFITKCCPHLMPKDLNRSHVIDYLCYLNMQPLNATSKNIALIHLRTFIEIVAQEEWAPFPKERLIYDRDIPKQVAPAPRFIPETVMVKLLEHLPVLPSHTQRIIFILQETGRRIGEICTLPFNCLEKDNHGDCFLRIYDRKLKKNYLIPITEACKKNIEEQQNYVRSLRKEHLNFLFIGHHNGSAPHTTARHINKILNRLAEKKKIIDDNGNIWHFHAHQFRHTVGTRMINAGVPQPIVQRYLGHESSEMTSRYAHIHNQTLKEEFAKFQGKLINIHGQLVREANSQIAEEQWLKQHYGTSVAKWLLWFIYVTTTVSPCKCLFDMHTF